jgi:hypothetical protein
MTPALAVTPALAALAAAALGGCAKFDLGDAALVDGLRLLGVQAEPPEVLPGAPVELTAWVVDSHGGGVAVDWYACFLPSNGLAHDGCTDADRSGVVALGSGPAISMTAPALDPTIAGPPDATFGVFLPIVVHVTSSDGDTLEAIYRLRVRMTAPPGCPLAPPYPKNMHCEPNTNPAFSDIEPLGGDGPAVQAHAGQIWALLAHYTADSDEEYRLPDGPEPVVPERLTTQWFATAGTFPDMPVGGTAVQKLTLDRELPPSGGTVDLWVVGHDDRGGTGMLHRQLVLQ